MAYSDVIRQEALDLVRSGLTVKDAARRLVISPVTVGKWVKEARSGAGPQDSLPQEGRIGPSDAPGGQRTRVGSPDPPEDISEAKLASRLLQKAYLMLDGVEHSTPRDRLATSTAVYRLLNRYFVVVGKSTPPETEAEADSSPSEVERLLSSLMRVQEETTQ